MNCWNRFRQDETGFVVSTELMLVGTVLVIGMLVGLVSVRDQVVQEMGDLAEAASDFDQSYTFAGWSGLWSEVSASDFIDKTDFCDVAEGQKFDRACAIYSACIFVQAPPSEEMAN